MPAARWDGPSGALNFLFVFLAFYLFTGVGPSEAVRGDEMATSIFSDADICDKMSTLPSRIEDYLDFADLCLRDAPGNMELLDGDVLVMFHRLNEVRVEHDLPVLSWHKGAAETARLQAIDMMRRNYFAHVNPEGLRNEDRLRRVQRDEIFGVSGENLAWYRDGWPESYTGETLQLELEDSPSHFNAMINPDYTHAGAAIVRQGNTYIAVQVFVTPEGELDQIWPSALVPGEHLSLPATLSDKPVAGWRLMDDEGHVIARAHDREVVVPDTVSGPVKLIVLAAESRTSFVLLNGPAADLISNEY